MAKNIPLRTCVGCGQKQSQKDLARIVRTKEGVIKIGRTAQDVGRSVYLCQNEACLKTALKRKPKDALSYGLKQKLTAEFKKKLHAHFEDLKKED